MHVLERAKAWSNGPLLHTNEIEKFRPIQPVVFYEIFFYWSLDMAFEAIVTKSTQFKQDENI